MSKGLGYFPPHGTKFWWSCKHLTYSPWVCCLSDQAELLLSLWPLNVSLVVDLIDGVYKWSVQVIDFKGQRSTVSGEEKSGLEACTKAEEVGILKLRENFPDWARTALLNGWRPPSV